jgi:hypothetical protein
MTLQELANKCAGDLPELWSIQLRLERHSGGVVLIDPDGDEDDISLESGVEAAILQALEIAVNEAPTYWEDSKDE